MKIDSVASSEVHFIDVIDKDIHGNETTYEYIRLGKNNWMMRYGESYESILSYEESELEKLFQEYQSQKID